LPNSRLHLPRPQSPETVPEGEAEEAPATVQKVKVVWPSGTVQVVTEPKVDTYIVNNENNGGN
jgi:hypothetical protein